MGAKASRSAIMVVHTEYAELVTKQPVVRVLHILGPLRPSGMERMLVSAADDFRDEGVSAYVYGLTRGSTFIDELRQAGYEVTLGAPVGRSLRAARTLRRLVAERQIDVIHIHTEGNWLQTVLASRWAVAGRRSVIVRTVHNNFLASGRWLASRRLQALFGDRFVRAIVAPSPDVAESERSVRRECRVIFNWVDDRMFELYSRRQLRQPGARAEHAVIVGNCSDIKRHELALEAIWAAGLRLSHVGDETDASARERDLLDRFEDAGRLVRRGVQPPDDVLVDGDIFCMPSRFEGFGVAFAEALVAGLPCLVSDSPGLHWARDVDGVRLLPDDVSVWEAALTDTPANSAPTIPDGIDLSASRGAHEYATLYREVLSR